MKDVPLYQKANLLWLRMISWGITDETSFEEKKKVRLLNIFAICGFPFCLMFGVINFYQQRFPLVIINVSLSIGSLLILITNRERKYILGRLFLSLISTAVFSVAAIFYKNGGEYFLLLNIVATVILFENTKYVIVVSALNALMFLVVKYLHPVEFGVEAVPPFRTLLNIAWTLLFMIIALQYYKTEHVSYQHQIEDTNDQLMAHQEQLLAHQEQLELKSSQLEILNNTKEKLFSIIAHDMRTPIAGLKSSLDLYHNNVISKQEFDVLSQQLTTQVDNLYNNLDNLLQWSHSQLKGIHAKPELIAVKPLVLQTIMLLLHNANAKHLQIEQRIADHIKLYADPDHVRLVLRNLLSNAIKFSNPNGTIEVGARLLGDSVSIFVKDNGIGMSEASLQKLFNTDELLSKRGTNNETGTGLGLSLCKEFVESNDGSFIVSSEEGKGSCFTFLLPAKP